MKKKLADHYYDRYDYYKAIPMYEQLLRSYPRNFQVYEKLADSYRRINDSRNAERCYAFLMDSSNIVPEYKLYYAQALARNGKYELSGIWYGKYSLDKPEDIRGAAFKAAYESVGQFFKDSSNYSIKKAAFNSPVSDFSPMYFRNGIVFSSARQHFSVIKFLYNWTASSYLDLYFADSAEVVPFSHSINSIYHEGPVTFSPTQDTIIFTRSNYNHLRFRKSYEGINKLKLFQAHWSKLLNKWIEIKPLPFNSDNYSVGHPAFADNGHTLYFVSDKPGGFGGTDIYCSNLIADSLGNLRWSNPENLGSQINTPGNEMFPFIDIKGNLWFSSNGWPGLGGLDMFVANKTSNGFFSPQNLGTPLNSRFDDFGLIIRNEGLEGMFTSDRYTEVGNDDIYNFKLNTVVLRGIVRDSADKKILLRNANVVLISNDGNTIANVETDSSGSFEFRLNFHKEYSLKATKNGYQPRLKKISASEHASVLNENMDLSENKSVTLFGTILDKNTGEKLTGVKVIIVDTIANANILDTTTAADGNFRKILNSIKLNDNLGYSIRLVKKGYLSKNISFHHIVKSSEINLNNYLEVSLDKIELGTDIGKLLKINPIYFDLGKWNIRPDAAAELDKIVKAMNDNPNLVIELGSHTDSRGSSQANLILSDKRAKASAAYIISKGIDKKRIYGKGYGETQLLNKCSDGVKCTEEEHAINRRTEFRIVKF